ncbi:MAG: hypothetical protein ACYDBB_15980 [Armatimonadota bacterium]
MEPPVLLSQQEHACPKCGYLLTPLDTDCPRCRHLAEAHNEDDDDDTRATQVAQGIVENVIAPVIGLPPAAEAEEQTEESATIYPPTKKRLHITVGGIFAALPDFGMAGAFLISWIAPATFGPRFLEFLLLLLLVEFVTICSTAVMLTTMYKQDSRSRRISTMLLFGLMCTTLTGAYSLMFHTWWPVIGFWSLTGKRILAVAFNRVPVGELRQQAKRGMTVPLMLYVVGAFATTLLPLPRLGITPQATSGLHLGDSGLWVEQPQTFVAFGFLYFLALAFSSMVDHRWIGDVQIS